LIIFALIDGEFISFSSVMSLLFDYYNSPVYGVKAVYGASLISLYGGATAIFGVAASMVAGVMLQKNHKYLYTIRAVCLGVALAGFAIEFTLPAENKILVLVNVIILGIFLVPIIPVSMNFGAEITFPLPPALTNGLLLMVG